MRITERFDIHAPILPGKGAAGLLLGEPVAPILQELIDVFCESDLVNPYIETHLRRYNSKMVDLWEKDGVVDQIMVHDGYQGTYAGVIGIGSTLSDVERLIGPWFEDEVDELEIRGIEGMCFDVDSYPLTLKDPAFFKVPISHICIFPATTAHELSCENACSIVAGDDRPDQNPGLHPGLPYPSPSG